MASGHVNRINKPNKWLHRQRRDVKIRLANQEPQTFPSAIATSALPLKRKVGQDPPG